MRVGPEDDEGTFAVPDLPDTAQLNSRNRFPGQNTKPSMHLYAYLLKLQLLNALAYRFEYLSSIGRNLFFLLGSVFLWRTAYRGIDQVAGVTEAQMVTYAVVAVLMNACFIVSIDNVLFSRIRAGEIALDLIRPVNLVSGTG